MMLFTAASHKVSIIHQCHSAAALHLNNTTQFLHFRMVGPNFWPTLYHFLGLEGPYAMGMNTGVDQNLGVVKYYFITRAMQKTGL